MLDHVHLALRPSRTALAAVGAVAVLVGLAGGAAAVDLHGAETLPQDAQVTAPAPEQAAAPARTDGFDPATCYSAAPAPQAAPAVTGETAVSFVVTGRTVISVDAAGDPVTVTTNTRQAPCITDTFVRVAPDGTATLAEPGLRDAVLSVQFGSAWQPGLPEQFPSYR